MDGKTYLCIDYKSFYASVECIERGLDPMTTNLVVADESRTEKTICLAVSPSLKAFGISGRARLFEVVQRVAQVNAGRISSAPGHAFHGASHFSHELKRSPGLSLDYIVARPRMALYIEYSTRIYRNIYLKYFAPEDIHVYSIDEVMIDVSSYLHTYKLTAHELAVRVILDVIKSTGITATAGIGTNLYLSKVAMDIGAKHIPADKNGVLIATLDEKTYRKSLWSHRPITDFWRIGRGYATKLEAHGLYTMGDVARCSMGKPNEYYNEDLLYKLFGINAELLIDHAWGWEPCTITDIKAYKPDHKSTGTGQVLHMPAPFDKARLNTREMTELLARDLLAKGLVTNQLALTVGYDISNLNGPARKTAYQGDVTVDRYGRHTPKHAHGTASLGSHTSSVKRMLEGVSDLFDRIVDQELLVRRINLVANNVIEETAASKQDTCEQLDLFTDYAAVQAKKAEDEAELEREKKRQLAILKITGKYGNSAIIRGMNLQEGATTLDRNKQIGGHRS